MTRKEAIKFVQANFSECIIKVYSNSVKAFDGETLVFVQKFVKITQKELF